MLETGAIAGRLHRHLVEQSRRFAVEDVRIGAKLRGRRPDGRPDGCRAPERVCRHAERNSQLRAICGKQAETLLARLVYGTGAMERALGLATANALIHPPAPERKRTRSPHGSPPRRAGRHGGAFPTHRAEDRGDGWRLSVIERETPAQERRQALGACDVAIVTATTLLNGTLEGVLSELGRPRHVALIGPSTPLCEEIFRGTPVTHLGGSAIVDGAAVLQVISRGGGTPDMRPCLRFVNIRVHRS